MKEQAVTQKVNFGQAFAAITKPWEPHVVGDINNFQAKAVKLQGSFVWHHHEHEDELFLVVKGRFLMKFRDGNVWVEEGEMIVVPHGVEHCPEAPEECHVLLLEPSSTLNTGNITNERTVAKPKRLVD
jgi:mannose-6-phosphate isomerase-like protein (cupin superfamily)